MRRRISAAGALSGTPIETDGHGDERPKMATSEPAFYCEGALVRYFVASSLDGDTQGSEGFFLGVFGSSIVSWGATIVVAAASHKRDHVQRRLDDEARRDRQRQKDSHDAALLRRELEYAQQRREELDAVREGVLRQRIREEIDAAALTQARNSELEELL
jgi:hypothetical protein